MDPLSRDDTFIGAKRNLIDKDWVLWRQKWTFTKLESNVRYSFLLSLQQLIGTKSLDGKLSLHPDMPYLQISRASLRIGY